MLIETELQYCIIAVRITHSPPRYVELQFQSDCIGGRTRLQSTTRQQLLAQWTTANPSPLEWQYRAQGMRWDITKRWLLCGRSLASQTFGMMTLIVDDWNWSYWSPVESKTEICWYTENLDLCLRILPWLASKEKDHHGIRVSLSLRWGGDWASRHSNENARSPCWGQSDISLDKVIYLGYVPCCRIGCLGPGAVKYFPVWRHWISCW